MNAIGARRLVDRVRSLVQDYGATAWRSDEVLDAVDAAMGEIAITRAQAGEDHEIDRITYSPSDFTEVAPYWYELRLPEYVKSVRKVEGRRTGASSVVPILEGTLEDKDREHSAMARGWPRWMFTGPGRPGTLSIVGDPSRFNNVTVWILRRYPPLHFGTAKAGGSTTTILFDDSATTLSGRVIKRPDLYVGMDLEFDAGATDEDQLVRVTAFDGQTATFEPAITTATDGQPYSVCAPIEPEALEYLQQKTAFHLAQRAGNLEQIRALSNYLRHLEDRYRVMVASRSSSAPKRFYSSRE